MDTWQGDIKKLGAALGKGIIRGTKTIAEAAKKTIVNTQRKQQIIDRMYPKVVRELAHTKGLRPQPTRGYRPTDEDYRQVIMSGVSLEELVEFANKKRVPIRDITDGIDKEKAEQDIKELSEDGDASNEFKGLVRSIIEFKPLKNYRSEYPYQSELAQWLKSRFTNTKIEVQRGSSRPDIVVNNGLAIEVKGPTKDEDLVTIADKCMRYSKHFRKGIIIVLFNVSVNRYRYKEWSERIHDTFGHITSIQIIRK